MRNLIIRPATAIAFSLAATVARAAGDSGTSSMGEMTLTGGQLGMMVGGLAGLGVVFWGLAKLMNK